MLLLTGGFISSKKKMDGNTLEENPLSLLLMKLKKL